MSNDASGADFTTSLFCLNILACACVASKDQVHASNS